MRNIKTKKKLRIMAMMVVLFLPIAATAQGGLFQRGDEPTGYRGDSAHRLGADYSPCFWQVLAMPQ